MQKFLFLLGPGGTGKSTFLRLLFAMLGPTNCATTDLRNLEQNRFESALLYGKRLAAITDAGRYTGAVDVLKAITGQDAIRREEKHKQSSGTFTFEGMVLIASNEPLAATDYTSGLDRRRLVVEFQRQFTASEQATFASNGGEDALHAEIPAIVNWALELSREEVENIFKHPPIACAKSTRESLLSQNPVADWINDNLAPEPGHWCMIGVKRESRPFGGGSSVFEDADEKLYPNYLRWCSENKRESLSLRRFRHTSIDMMRTLGHSVIEARRGGGQGISGVKILTESEKCRIETALSVGKPTPGVVSGVLEPAPVLEVLEMQDFGPTFFEKKSADAEVF